MPSRTILPPFEDPKEVCGHATISPQDRVHAGTHGTWTLTYVAGRYGLDDGGRIMVARRLASDWGTPQFENPEADEYTTVSTTGRASLRAFWDQRAFIRPWRAAVVVQVFDGYLGPGDMVVITYGDTRWGSRGSRAQTFPEETFEFRVLVDPHGTGQFLAVPNPPELRVIAGPVARLTAVAPTQVPLGESFCLTIRAEDRWGNPSYDYQGTVEIGVEPGSHRRMLRSMRRREHGVHRVCGLRLPVEGLYRIRVEDDERGLTCFSNPVQTVSAQSKERLYWGDIHGQTEATVGTGSVEEYFTYGRDVAALDFLSHCGNDFQITAQHWHETQEVVQRYNEPGRFVTLLGYEWSGNTCGGGDRNVYFLGDEGNLHRSGHWQIEDRSDEEDDRFPVERLYEEFAGRGDVLIVPHVGGRWADLSRTDLQLSPVIEICSVHGVFEWFMGDALEQGLVVGFIGGSDDHTGRPGWAPPGSGRGHFGGRGGLVGIYSESLTREGIWEALRNRRCYATTGERILVDFSVDGRPMGARLATGEPPVIVATATGTNELRTLEILRGTEVVYRYPQPDPRLLQPGCIEVMWGGSRQRGRGRRVIWDGELTISGGRFLAAKEYAFLNPDYGITARGDSRITWACRTVGSQMGLLLEVEGEDAAKLTFTTGPTSFSFSLGQLALGGVSIELDGPDQRVVARRARPTVGDEQAECKWIDQAVCPGLNPYYLKVTQVDGHMAWSSPVYVDFTPKG